MSRTPPNSTAPSPGSPTWLDLLGQVLAEDRAAAGRPPSSLLETRVSLEVLAACGVTAAAVPVQVVIFNAPLAADIRARGSLPTEQEMSAWMAAISGGATVGLGFGEDVPGAWAGHLVVMTHDGLLFDPALCIAASMAADLSLPHSLVRSVTPGFRNATQLDAFPVDDCLAAYQRTENARYRDLPAWSDEAVRAPIVRRVLQRLAAAGAIPPRTIPTH